MPIIKLICRECENQECIYCPLGSYIPEFSKRGCLKKVSEEDSLKMYHYLYEVVPLMQTGASKEKYEEILNFLNERIYTAKTVNLLDAKGKRVKINEQKRNIRLSL